MSYETRHSDATTEFVGGGHRDSQEGKLRFDLVMPEGVPLNETLFARWAALMGRGAEHYDERNWEQFGDAGALAHARSSAFRHFMQWWTGDTPEEDHAAAVLFNIQAVENIRRKMSLSA